MWRDYEGIPNPPFEYNGSINVSSLANGTYTLIVRTTSLYGYPPENQDQKTTTFTINRPNPCSFSCNLAVTPSSGPAGSSFTFALSTQNAQNCSTGTNRKYEIDYTNNGSYDATTAWISSGSNSWTNAPYSSNGTYTAKGRVQWRNNTNGTVTRTCTDTVTVSASSFTLTVAKAGTGSGTVTSAPAGISCGSDCSQGYSSGTSVTLTATPATGSTFTGWSGACSGTGSCVVSMTQNRSVTATFNTGASVTATISASPSPVTYGQGTTITWGSTNATYCYANPEGQTVGFFTGTQPSGTAGPTAPLHNNTVFAVNCGNTSGGSAGATTTVKVTPECLPAGQTVDIGEQAGLTARGGNGTYSWSATGGTPSSDTGGAFFVSYTTSGTKTVTVSSDGMTGTACTVTVNPPSPTTGTVIVRSFDNLGNPFATTWILSGPPGGYNNELSNQTEKIYEPMPVGTYIIDPADTKNGYTLTDITPVDSQYLEAGDTVVFVLEYTQDPPAPGADVDIKANGDDGPVYVSEANPMAYLTWTSSDIEPGTCVGTSNNKGVASWNGNPKDDDGAEWSPTITGPITFIITCDVPSGGEGIGGASGTVSDSVIVDLRPPQCSDGEDNDGDKQTDYPNDPGCQSADDDDEANATQCSDNIDNDDPEDELIDMNDPGCSSPQDDDELNQATTVTQCNNGLDDDGDGVIDYDGGGQTLPDPGCESALDPSETDDPDIREI
ncbi:MAG: hypothetical protein AMXMBFR44_2250 [Candidatus Campbellbacteria bacterium]